MENLNLTQQKHASTNQKQCITTQNKHKLPNIGGALCSTQQSLADAQHTTKVPWSNAAKTRNPLKFEGVPQTRQQISAVSSSPY